MSVFKEVITRHEISEESVRKLLGAAFNNGIGYWGYLTKYEYPYCTVREDFVEGGKYAVLENGKDIGPVYLLPFHRGGGLIIEEKAENVRHTLTREKMMHGLDMMAQKYPNWFQNVLNGHITPSTGDLFVQCCLFDDIVFGN